MQRWFSPILTPTLPCLLSLLLLLLAAGPGVSQIPERDREAALRGMEWRNIGPDRGGRSLGIAGHPDKPFTYYFGATGGGLWKTEDGGATWRPVTDGQITSSSIGAVAVAESDPDIVYIGGGEVQLRGSITQGDGVYRSADGGETWEHKGLRETQAVARIRVHPRDADLVYVAALGHPYGPNPERGVFRSRDGGDTWDKVLFVSDSAGAVDLILDPGDPETMYATTWQVYRKAWKMWGGGPDSGLWKSTDGGDTWQELTDNPGMPEPPIGKIGVTVSPADRDRVWAIVEADEGGVFRSDDGGRTWERTNDERKLRQRAFYYSRIYADPLDRETVYALNTRLFKSVDGGVTFDLLDSQPPHGDQHDLWLDPGDPTRMANANDGGGNISINGGRTWTEQDFPTTQLYHVMATNDVPYHVCGAQQDNSTVCVPSDDWDFVQARGPNHGWYYAVGGGESGWISQHPEDLDIFYSGSQGALLTRYDRSNGQVRDIQVHPRFFSGEPASALPERWQWTFPIVFSPLDPGVMYTVSQHVWRTTDDGQSWQRISPDLTLADPATLGPTGGLITMDMNGPEIYATVFALEPSQHDAAVLWAGSDDGLVHITRDGGASWQDITPPDMPEYTRVSIIDESPHDPGTAFMAANRYQVDDRAPYVWRTTDYGQSWTMITNGIEDGHFARSVREDPVRPELLFLGTEHGVYVSFDAGAEWQPLQLNLPDTPIRDLVITDDAFASDVVVGTHGRGFWILDDIEPLREASPRVLARALHLFEPQPAMRQKLNQGWGGALGGHAAVQYWLGRAADRVTIEILDDDGNLVQRYASDQERRTIEADAYEEDLQPLPTTNRGVNRWEWDLTYPGATVAEGMILWRADAHVGPAAPPGTYTARVTANGRTEEGTFEVRLDPRLEGVTVADVEEQFRLAMQIRDATGRANEAVIRIREIREAVQQRLDRAGDARLRQEAEPLLRTLAEVEDSLYQSRNRSHQDPLNFPIRLNNRLATLRVSVENGEARPTDGHYQVFRELNGELEMHLDRLEQALETDLTRLNRAFDDRGLAPVSEAGRAP